METFQTYIEEYRQQLAKGAIQKAYRGLMDYLQSLKAHLKTKYPGYFVSGSLYFGYLDMSYFSFHPQSLADRKLKVAIVFNHEAFRFEAWLAGANKRVQAKYWQFFKRRAWEKYPLVPSIDGVDAILEHILVAGPDFRDLGALTAQIETGALAFIEDVEGFLSTHDPL